VEYDECGEKFWAVLLMMVNKAAGYARARTHARLTEWQWHQLGHMQVCISLQTDYHASTPPLSFFTGRMPFLPPNKQRQSTEINTAGTD